MTLDELASAVAVKEHFAHEHMLLTVRRHTRPKRRNVQVVPGLRGHEVGWERGMIFVDVTTADVRAYLTRRGYDWTTVERVASDRLSSPHPERPSDA